MYQLINVESTASTNDYAKHLERDDDRPFVINTDCQTQGRGQRGNSWESEPGKNLTFTLVVYPAWLAPAMQFELSMLVSVAIVDTLRPYVENPELLKVKWPNDIYYGDRKLAGILIENTVTEGQLKKAYIGIGLNVNQREFQSDAPNPVSLAQIDGVDIDKQPLLDKLVNNILDIIEQYEQDPEVDELTYLYNNMLWRKDGVNHLWSTPDGKEFEAQLIEVQPDGQIVLQTTDGERHNYLFKEIAALL